MLSSRTHVLGLACKPLWQIRPFRTLPSSWCSRRCTTTRCLSRYWTFSLETGCSSRTATDLTTYYREGWMWLLPLRRLAMYHLEHPGPRWIRFLQTKEQGVQTQFSQKTLGPQPTSFVSRMCIERTSFFKLSRSGVRDFDSLVHFFLIMKMREDRLSASTGIFFLKTQL